MTLLKKNDGFSLVEILVALAIFSVIIAVVVSSYITQVKHTGREYRVAETEIETGIAKGIIERDIAMAGYGIAEDYGATGFNPMVASATNDNPDTLTLTGTALGMKSRQAQAWTYINGVNPTFGPASTADTTAPWSDSRENLEANDRVILMEPGTKKLLVEGTEWLFKYDGSNGDPANRLKTLSLGTTYSTPSVGTLVYGLCGSSCAAADITQPYYAVRYYWSGTPPSNCASGTKSLLRAESTKDASPASGDPILDCVLDVEVAFGLDTDENGTIDAWDNGGVAASGYAASDLRKRLKQIRFYILVQSGNYDASYTSPFTSIRVGDSILATGRDVAITGDLLRYRWRMLAISITPRNIR
ncbi:MAG: prepilin-type N-terminal cleavage/methylation domain-containing protein [Deltaproteobacteria bacterium]|nr:prepilin-type N-terminal cleavage/methylation domain-containing protein [Deltaproteobacteria bacterium]